MTEVRILLLEDNPADAELVLRQLTRANMAYTAKRVSSETAFRRELSSGLVDVILSDYHVPGFDGMAALRVARILAPEVPFIFVSGSLGEERAVAALQEGATDYVVKDRPARLPVAVQRALAERREVDTQREMRDALRSSEQRFHLAVMATRDVIWDLDIESGRVWMNEAITNEWGYLLEDEVDKEWWTSRIHPDDLERVLAAIDQTIAFGASRWSANYRFRRADGAYGEVYDRAMVVRRTGGAPIRMIGAMQDVTERNAAEHRVHELSRYNRLVLEHIGEGIVGIDESGAITFANPAAGRILGWSEGLQLPIDHSVLDPDGACNPECLVQHTLSDGAPRHGERIIERSGGQSVMIDCSTTAIVVDGGVTGCVVTFRDVTEQKRLKQKLDQAQRVSSLGRVAATIAHEFNNVLMGIQPFAEAIRRSTNEPKLIQSATQIVKSVARGRKVTGEILRITQDRKATPKSLDVGEWLRQLLPEIDAVTGPDVRVDLSVAESLFARFDPEQLQQVVLNLAVNARDAMTEGGLVAIAAEPSDSMVRISVRDEGTGIPDELLPHLFEPLFTTKRKGTGLGLAVAHQLVTLSGGTISVRSTVGQGTRFDILLPASAAPEPAAPAESAAPFALRRLVLVEDEPTVSEGLSTLLALEGIEVRVADSADAAIAVIAAFDPEAVVLDVNLGETDGTTVFQEIAARWPRLPVVFSTGNGDTARLERYLERPHVELLLKPYDAPTLIEALRKIV